MDLAIPIHVDPRLRLTVKISSSEAPPRTSPLFYTPLMPSP